MWAAGAIVVVSPIAVGHKYGYANSGCSQLQECK